MNTQIAHDTEIHRQHVRLRIPIAVEIDGTRYVADDWSLGGFGVESGITSRQPGDRFPVRLFFPFEDFEIVLHVDCQMVYVTEQGDRFGCRFLGLTPGQTELFRYLVESYLSGEIISAGDVLIAASREAGAKLRRLTPDDEAGEEGFRTRLRRWFGHTVLGLVALALVVLVYLGVREKYLVVQTDDALIWVPLVELRAPFPGRIEALPRKPIFRPDDPVGRIVGTDGVIAPLASPCECTLLQWAVPPGSYVQTGEPVVTLAAADQPLLVRAQLPIEDARELRVGQRAEVYLPGHEEPVVAQIERIDFKPDLSALARNGPEAATASRKAQIYLRPDRPFDFELLGSLVSVRFT